MKGTRRSIVDIASYINIKVGRMSALVGTTSIIYPFNNARVILDGGVAKVLVKMHVFVSPGFIVSMRSAVEKKLSRVTFAYAILSCIEYNQSSR
jgi:hypothetical protein